VVAAGVEVEGGRPEMGVGEKRKRRRGTLLGARAAGRRRHQGKGSDGGRGRPGRKGRSAAAAAPPELPNGGAREGGGSSCKSFSSQILLVTTPFVDTLFGFS